MNNMKRIPEDCVKIKHSGKEPGKLLAYTPNGELIPMVTGIEIYYQAGSLIKARIDLLVHMTDTSNDEVARQLDQQGLNE